MTWARFHDACRKCGGTTRKHRGRGFCQRCWHEENKAGRLRGTLWGMYAEESMMQDRASDAWDAYAAELRVIREMLLDANRIDEYRSYPFADPACAAIRDGLVRLENLGKPMDYLSLMDEMRSWLERTALNALDIGLSDHPWLRLVGWRDDREAAR